MGVEEKGAFVTDNTMPSELRLLLQERRWQELAERQEEWPEVNLTAPLVTELLLELKTQDQVLLFRALPRDLAAAVITRLRPGVRDRLLLALTDSETRQLLGDMQPDDRTHLLRELPGQATQRLLNLVPSEALAMTRKLLGYPQDSVGRLMTPDYLAVRPDWTIAGALEHIRARFREDDTSNTVYVVDGEWRLVDDLPLQRLVLSDPQLLVSDIMDGQYVSLSAHTDREEAVLMMARYDRIALPVVDSDGILVGIVTVDDVLDVAAEEVTEDFYRSSAIEPLRGGNWGTGIAALYQRRIG